MTYICWKKLSRMSKSEAADKWHFVVRNDSHLAIFCMNAVGMTKDGHHTIRHHLQPVLAGPKGSYEQKLPLDSTEEASIVEFRVAAGLEWKRYADRRPDGG